MSVSKRTWKTTKGVKKEAWLVGYRDANGARRFKNFARKKDADTYAAKTAVDIGEGVHVPDRVTVTIREAGERWIKSCIADDLEQSTIAQYRQHLDLHIFPFIGTEKLSKLSVPFVREFHDRLLAGGDLPIDKDGKPDMRAAPRSPTMVRYVVRSLGTLLADAQERGLIARNPVSEMRRNRRKRNKSDGKDKRGRALKVGEDIPTGEEIKAILNAATGRYRPLIWTAIFTGLRASELRGLRWEDVDLEKRKLRVHQRADRYNDIGAPKTAASERTIELPPPLVNELRAWKVASKFKKPADYVFPTGKGKVEYHINIVKRGLWPAQIAAGVTRPVLDAQGKPVRDEDGKPVTKARYPGLHALRHFYASWCAKQGMSQKEVQVLMGHSNIAVTLDTYTHLFESDSAGRAARLDAAAQALLG